MTSLQAYIRIDKRIDAAEERSEYLFSQAEDSLRESLRDRWEFGRLLLAERVGKQLPRGRMAELVEATGKSQSELSYRAQFAERYSTEEQVSRAMETFDSWTQIKASLPRSEPKATTKSKPKPAPPKYHPRRKEVINLAEDGLSHEEIAQETGVGQRQVRHIVEREHIEQAVKADAKADAIAINWDSLPKSAKEREAVMRKVIRRELEAEFEPRVQAEVQERTAWARKYMDKLYDEYREVMNARKGIFSRADYNLIQSCLHPDSRLSVSDAKLGKAFQLFRNADIPLLSEKDRPTTTLPSSLDQLRRRKQERKGAI